ncbi:MAG: methyl-accepting chemotaxis protein [Treponema sp.]|jgi:methyl-accepting chemotaxis protein|nr:methyl-accepting chemotaxis protein [Treponema sp.]
MKLKYRLSIMVISILVLVIATISTVLLNRSSGLQMADARKNQILLAAERTQFIQRRYESYLMILRTLSNMMADFDQADVGRQRNRFDQLLESTLHSEERILDMYVVFKPNTIDYGMDDTFIGVQGNTENGQFANWYIRRSGQIEHLTYNNVSEVMAILDGPSGRRELVTDPIQQTVNGTSSYIVGINVPIIHRLTNQLVGRVGMHIDTVHLQPIVEDFMRDPATTVSAMTIYTNNTTIIASYDSGQIGKLLKDAQKGIFNTYTDAVYNAVINGQVLTVSDYSSAFMKDLELIIYPFTIGETGRSWSLMLGTEKDIILAAINSMTVFTVIIAGAAIILVGILMFMLSVSITNPIGTVAATLKSISEGEGDLTTRIAINSKDEIGDLARYFNRTLSKIKTLVFVIKKQSMALSDVGSKLANNMTETAAAINEITTNIQSIRGQIINQSTSIKETNATMQQINLNIDKLNRQINRQSISVAKSSSAVEEMLANIDSVTQTLIKNAVNVQDLQNASEEGRTGIQEVAQDIQGIAQESEGLLEINKVIKNIASQTNLLSMNAAIEAAHAGDAGRGFAIVAEEIRKLAENSGKQSRTISTVLKKIKNAIDKIILSTNRVLNKFEAIDSSVQIVSFQEENIRNAMEEQGAGSKQILDAVGGLNDITHIVQDGSKEMGEGSKQVILESEHLEKLSQEINNGINEMASGAEQINVAINWVNSISVENKENINVLVQEVSRFKIE